jgi:hypothetical protein
MTQARSHIVSKCRQALNHCVARCVRLAWCPALTPPTGVNHEQRKQAADARVRQWGEMLAGGIRAYAVISNRLRVVLSVEPEATAQW